MNISRGSLLKIANRVLRVVLPFPTGEIVSTRDKKGKWESFLEVVFCPVL